MTATDSIETLFADLSSVRPELEAVLRLGENVWEVEFAGLPPISVERDDEGERLFLSAELGVPAPSRRADVLEAAMAYAMLQRETGGVRLGSPGPDQPIALLADIACPASAESFAQVLENFAGKGAIWSEFVLADTSADFAPPTAGAPAESIRV